MTEFETKMLNQLRAIDCSLTWIAFALVAVVVCLLFAGCATPPAVPKQPEQRTMAQAISVEPTAVGWDMMPLTDRLSAYPVEGGVLLALSFRHELPDLQTEIMRRQVVIALAGDDWKAFFASRPNLNCAAWVVPFDADDIGVDLFRICRTGPNVPVTFSPCLICDCDGDGDVDQGDFGLWQGRAR